MADGGADSPFGGGLSRRREIAFAEWSRHRSEKPGKTLLWLLDRRTFELPWMVHDLFSAHSMLWVWLSYLTKRASLPPPCLLRTLRELAALPACRVLTKVFRCPPQTSRSPRCCQYECRAALLGNVPECL
ncbi:hypothetical protein CMEL01_04209 [Colletotrichum melonis]|uniref:Uncharacterized protein n=1 Tax=Colletotrichum melonis TaxID=1209925 RepID=A0AAI9UBU7_9PEZI|nr:hypothetical protein CMEL01_04209 [Colletotrichum melonis]